MPTLHLTRRLFCLTGSVAAVSLALGSAPLMAQELRKVDIAIPQVSLPVMSPMLADGLGLFEKHGLDPNFIVVESSSAGATALIAGSLEVIVSGPGEQVAAAGRGQELIALNSVFKGMGGTISLSKAAAEKTGISPDATAEERWKALDGLVIASPSPTSSYTVAVKGASMAAGADIRFTYMPFTNMVAAMDAGAIDGFMSSAPVWTTPVADGRAVSWISGPKGDFPADFSPVASAAVMLMRDHAEADPELVKAIEGAMDEFAEVVRNDPESVKKVLAEIFPQLKPEEIDLIAKDEVPAMAMDRYTVEDLKHEIAFVKAAGANIPNIDSIDPARFLLD